jgi:hypothetical protein
MASRIAVADLDATLVTDLLLQATRRLRELYEAQGRGQDLAMADAVELELEALSRPQHRSAGQGQGFGLSAPERKAIELRAMVVAQEWLEAEGYKVKDTSRNSPFDFLATRAGSSLKVEVKGTTSAGAQAIFMTRNEVELHRREAGATALIIVSAIQLDRRVTPPKASGGELIAEIGWDIEAWELAPMAFRVSRRPAVEGEAA